MKLDLAWEQTELKDLREGFAYTCSVNGEDSCLHFYQPRACGSLLRERQTICSYYKVSLFSGHFPAAANLWAGEQRAMKGLCQTTRSTAVSRQEKSTYLFTVVKSILVAVGQIEFVNVPFSSLLSLCQFIQGSVELLLTRSLQEYHLKIVSTEITKNPTKKKIVIGIEVEKNWK